MDPTTTETIVRGRTWAFDLVYYSTYLGAGDPGNVEVDLTGYGLRSQVRDKVTGKLITNLPVTAPVPTNGAVAIRLSRDFTWSLPVSKTGALWWDMVATDPDGMDHILVYPEPFEIQTHPTLPNDNP